MTFVDVVNEQDEVIGKATKEECHAKSLLHRGSIILLFKDDSYTELLLFKRGMKTPLSPGKIGLPGGHVDLGESYLDAAKRELQEEAFVNGMPSLEFEELFTFAYGGGECNAMRRIYRVICFDEFSYNKEEVANAYFENIEKVYEDIEKNKDEYTPSTIEIIKKYRKKIN